MPARFTRFRSCPACDGSARICVACNICVGTGSVNVNDAGQLVLPHPAGNIVHTPGPDSRDRLSDAAIISVAASILSARSISPAVHDELRRIARELRADNPPGGAT